MNGKVLCVGEVLWDALPDGLFLGGAVFNVACHLHTLGAPAVFASRVGNDELGREVARRMLTHNLDVNLVQTDEDLPTGFVQVSLEGDGMPTYVIREPAAWDRICMTDELARAAAEAAAVVFGSLSQRSAITRQTLEALRKATPGIRIFDVNLRKPFIDRDVIERSLKETDLLKLNGEELVLISGWFGWPAEVGVDRLADRFGITTICVTRGADGALLWIRGDVTEVRGVAVKVEDTVGAGDAFLAALVKGSLAEDHPGAVLDRANRLGALVASHRGATPYYDPSAFGA